MKNTAYIFNKKKIDEMLSIFFIQLLFFLILIISQFLFLNQSVADSQDYLAGSKDMVIKNFGKDSTLVYFMYLGEMIVAIGSYIKSKNLFVLVGVIILMLFVNIVSGMI